MFRSFGKKLVTLYLTTKMSRLVDNACPWWKKLNFIFSFPDFRVLVWGEASQNGKSDPWTQIPDCAVLAQTGRHILESWSPDFGLFLPVGHSNAARCVGRSLFSDFPFVGRIFSNFSWHSTIVTVKSWCGWAFCDSSVNKLFGRKRGFCTNLQAASDKYAYSIPHPYTTLVP